MGQINISFSGTRFMKSEQQEMVNSIIEDMIEDIHENDKKYACFGLFYIAG